jgi:hypothetical protein
MTPGAKQSDHSKGPLFEKSGAKTFGRLGLWRF